MRHRVPVPIAPLPADPSRFMVAAHAVLTGTLPLLTDLNRKQRRSGRTDCAMVFQGDAFPCALGLVLLVDGGAQIACSFNRNVPGLSPPPELWPPGLSLETLDAVGAYMKRFTEHVGEYISGNPEAARQVDFIQDSDFALQALHAFYQESAVDAYH